MADAILYRSTDAGAPSPVGGSGTAINRFFEFIVPCLVTGYGTGVYAKPGQGWTLVHNGLPLGFTLQAPDGVFYSFVRANTTATTHGFIVFMAEALSDVTALPPVGTNVRSADYSADYNAAYGSRHFINCGDSSRPNEHWAVAARGSQALITNTPQSTASPLGNPPAGTGSYGSTVFLGNVAMRQTDTPLNGPQNSFVIGGCGIYPEGYIGSAIQTSYQLTGGHTRLRDPLSGALELGSLTSLYGPITKHGNTSWSKLALETFPPDLDLVQVDCWLEGQGAIGRMPGLFYMGRLSHYRTDNFLIVTGRGGQGYSDTIEPFTIGAEPFYYIPNAFGGMMVSLDEKYWV